MAIVIPLIIFVVVVSFVIIYRFAVKKDTGIDEGQTVWDRCPDLGFEIQHVGYKSIQMPRSLKPIELALG